MLRKDQVVQSVIDDVWNRGQLDRMEELCAPEYIYHAPAFPDGLSLKGLMDYIHLMRKAFPDLHMTLIGTPIREVDLYAVRWVMVGTHRGDFLGELASGQSIELHGMDVFHFENERLIEQHSFADRMVLMQQIGAMPRKSVTP
jgi:steroid delta-isomerase-like uncharacterized protein